MKKSMVFEVIIKKLEPRVGILHPTQHEAIWKTFSKIERKEIYRLRTDEEQKDFFSFESFLPDYIIYVTHFYKKGIRAQILASNTGRQPMSSQPALTIPYIDLHKYTIDSMQPKDLLLYIDNATPLMATYLKEH